MNGYAWLAVLIYFGAEILDLFLLIREKLKLRAFRQRWVK